MALTQEQVRITQIDGGISYARMFTHDTNTFTSRDTEAVDYDATSGFTLWTDERDVLFVGSASNFASVGLRLSTIPVGYGSFTVGYSKDAGPYAITAADVGAKTFTVAGDRTASFVANGFFIVSGSTVGNNGAYRIVSSSFGGGNTTITMTEAPVSAAATIGNCVAMFKPLTINFNNTSYTGDGWLAWVVPADLTSITLNGTAAKWIGFQQDSASVGTPAVALHLLRNTILGRPLQMTPLHEQTRYARDTGLDVRKTDLDYESITALKIGCTQIALVMADVGGLLMDWNENRNRLWIEDGALTSPPNFSEDAYYKTYHGRMTMPPYKAMSPGKMDPFEYEIDFAIYATQTIYDVLGI